MIVARIVLASFYLVFMFVAGAVVCWYALFGSIPW